MARVFAAASTTYFSKDAAVVTSMPLTVCAWFRPADVTATGVIWSLVDKDASNQFYQLFYAGANTPEPIGLTIAGGGAGFTLYTTNFCTVNTWHFAAGIFASATSRTVLLDADVANAGTNTNSQTPTGMDRTTIGCRRNTSGNLSPFNGRLAWVTVWNAVLGPDELTSPVRRVQSPRDTALKPGGLLAAVWVSEPGSGSGRRQRADREWHRADPDAERPARDAPG